jgi:hypothetical protein
VWGYTPRQIEAYIFIATLRHKRELAESLGMMTMAARGDPDDIQKQIRELERGY